MTTAKLINIELADNINDNVALSGTLIDQPSSPGKHEVNSVKKVGDEVVIDAEKRDPTFVPIDPDKRKTDKDIKK